MNKNLAKTLFLCFQLTVFSTLLLVPTIKPATAQEPSVWWDEEWLSVTPVNLTETLGKERISEPVDVHITFELGTCTDPNKEVRVLYFDGSKWTMVTSQVYNVTKTGEYAKSCNVVFLADCPASSTVTYYIYYNPSVPPLTPPEYDGLRTYKINEDDIRINVTQSGVEKKYAHVIWRSNIDLYSDGKRVCWPGGPPGWEFSQIVLASLWANASDYPWFSAGKILTVVGSGPLFADFNLTMPFATDLWGGIFNNKISTTYLFRVYYQPDLNPLVSYHMSLNFKEKDTVKNPVVVDFKLANSTSYEIYQDFTWKNLDQEVTTVSAKNDMPQTDLIWSAIKPHGWLSYNGSIPSMPDKPAANIGLIPTYAGGTIPSVNYVVNFTAAYPTTIKDPYYDHHCTTQLSATTNGVEGDVIESKGFIKTYKLGENAEPTMSDIATKLRYPESLEITVGKPYTTAFVDRLPPTITGIVPAMAGEEIVEGAEVNLEATVADNPAILTELIVENVSLWRVVQPSGVDKVNLHYSTDGGDTWEIMNMTKVGETDVYNVTILGFKSGTKVRYMIVATDKKGNEATSSTYWYKVRIASRTGMWFGLGIGVGFITAIIIAAVAFYMRKKP